QIHSFYITNIKSKLKFSKENFIEKELETIVNEISETLIENNNNKEESNLNDLLIAKLINLNFYNNNKVEDNTTLNNQQELEIKEMI
ncbi:29972_t:CDS:2, partial [Gigaspora margarita]